MQFKGKLIDQTWEFGRKSNFVHDFCPFWPKPGPQKFYVGFNSTGYIIASYHCLQFQGKLMNQTWENGKKPSFSPNFGPFGQNMGPKFFLLWILPLLDLKYCCKLSLHVVSRKTNEQNLRKWLWPNWPKFGCKLFFLQKSGFVSH